ncbi:MAG: hypothetical protein IJC48_11240 [Clostridia bacterium]|nr:hypothetical protein [Clostridia bacterium]
MPEEGLTFFASLIRYVIAISTTGVVTLFLGMLVPRKCNYRVFPFKPCAFEAQGRLYFKLRVHKWKDHIPDASKTITRMTRKAIQKEVDAQGLERLIQETCIAEISHFLLIALCPVYCLFVPIQYGIPFSILYALGNLPFIITQRYNRPRLILAKEKLEKREKRKAQREGAKK